MTRKLRTLRLTDQAETDLAEIWAYIANQSSSIIATNFFNHIHKKLEMLKTHPFLGAPRNQLRQGLRVIVTGRYASYYVVSDSDVIIIRVLHTARDIAAFKEYLQANHKK